MVDCSNRALDEQDAALRLDGSCVYGDFEAMNESALPQLLQSLEGRH
jgi:hypothetical protein